MPVLTACFTIPIDAYCLLQLPDEFVVETDLVYEDFSVKLRLLPSEGHKSKSKNDLDWTTRVYAIELKISRDDSEQVPDILKTPSGQHDHTFQSEFLCSRLDKYKFVAYSITNKALEYFRYALLTPSVRKIDIWHQAFSSPIWFDTLGNDLGSLRVMVAQPIFGEFGELGVQKLMIHDIPAFAESLSTSQEPSLELTLLADAQSAWFENGLRRAVLELAICAEVMVKRRYFSASSPAGVAFDYLEDRSRVSVRVIDLIDKIAYEALGKSYRVGM